MAKKTHDDLFEGTSMTFGEHLEELRVCLFRAIVGIAVGCVIGFFAANAVVRFFQTPLERAMERYYLDKAQTDYQLQFGDIPHEIRTMIVREGLIPDPLQIEAGALAETLRLTYPERFAGLELSPYWFTAGDLIDGQAQRIAAQLATAGRAKAASPAKAMWELMTAEQRKRVETLAASEAALTKHDSAELLAVLNVLAGNAKLHESPAFESIAAPDEEVIQSIRKSLAEAPDAEQTRRLNKLLIASAFPDELKPARINLLSIFTWRPVRVRFQVLNAQEAFMIWLKAALMTGLVIASPWIFYQVWIFVAAGLYPQEKNYVYIYLPISFLLFLGGASLAFLFVFDKVLDFLFLFNKGMNADFDPRIGEWLSFVLILPIGFGLSFQLPLVMLFINRLGLVSLETYIAQWRIAVLVIFVVAMILTPAEPISMLMMAVPLCALYVLGIAMCRYMPRGRNPFDEAYEP
jgi:sec-independent protein translocase protein TatC